MAYYEIVTTADKNPTHSSEWEADGVGDVNEFESIEEAQEAIESLKGLGLEWEEMTYGIREVGEKYPTEIEV